MTQAGSSIRLYTDGVFHSQYNPRRPVGGSLWDLLFLPALMHRTPHDLQRVLVLGVGGGAVIQQLDYFLQPAHIVGVDLDPVHLQIARRFFGIKRAGIQLVQAEATQWLRDYRGERFDIIIEDVFTNAGTGEQVEPVRALLANADWFQTLSDRLTPDGVLVMNFESRRSLRQSAYRQFIRGNETFAAAYGFSCSRYENTIAAFTKRPLERGEFVRGLRRHKELDTRRKTCRLDFQYRKLTA